MIKEMDNLKNEVEPMKQLKVKSIEVKESTANKGSKKQKNSSRSGKKQPLQIYNERNVRLILDQLDRLYGTTKTGFYHNELWQLLVAIMLSAQSTDKQVEAVIPGLFQKYPDVRLAADCTVEEIEDSIRTIGLHKSKAKNIKKCCQQIVNEYQGKVPQTIDELLTLAGVGRKTATLFLADAYDIPGVTVDTHVFRISRRLGWAVGKNPQTVELELQDVLPEDHWNRINFQLIYLGRDICTARKAHCEKCPLGEWCEKRLDLDLKD